MTKSSLTNWLLARWGVLVSAGILGLTFVLSHTHTHGPPCMIRSIFHIPCPGCGMTRSIEALWTGDLLTSVRYHPLGLPIFLASCTVLVLALLRRIAPQFTEGMDKRFARLHSTHIAWGTTALLLSIWLIRLGLQMAGNPFFQWDDIPLH